MVGACAGLPLQLAVLLGVAFSGLASLLFLLPIHDNGISGAVVMAMLLGASLLYGVFDFCAACWMFGGMLRLGLLPSNVHTASINQKVNVARDMRMALQYGWVGMLQAIGI